MPRTPSSGRVRGTTPSSSGSVQADDNEAITHGSAVPEQLPEHRMSLFPRHKEFSDSKAVRRLTKINRSFITTAWRSWSHIRVEVRQRMWERFQGFYKWEPCFDGKMQEIWEFKSAKTYKSNLGAARTRAAILSGASYKEADPNRDMNVLKSYPPDWLSPTIWSDLIDQWNNEHWKNISIVSRSNRNTKVDGDVAKHTARSISFSEHSARLTKERQGVPPTALQLFNHVHRKRSSTDITSSDTGEYVTSRCSRVAYKANLTQKYGEDTSQHPLVDKELWHQAVGGVKKGCLFGFGDNEDPNVVLTGTYSEGGASSSVHQELQILKSQLETIKETETRRDEENARRDEENADLRRKYDDLMNLVK